MGEDSKFEKGDIMSVLSSPNEEKGKPMVEIIFPRFVGDTEDGERITIYEIDGFVHLKVDDGEVWALSPGYKLTTYYDDLSSIMEVELTSDKWTGIARGGRNLVEMAEPLRRE